ncbi:hypothetical protein O9992_14550 [Vibrio lentus]|nr:hypothetical protein [Vibrio lentus]
MGIELTQDEYQSLETIAMDIVMDAAKLNQYTSFIRKTLHHGFAYLFIMGTLTALRFTISAAEQSVALYRCRAKPDVAESMVLYRCNCSRRPKRQCGTCDSEEQHEPSVA